MHRVRNGTEKNYALNQKERKYDNNVHDLRFLIPPTIKLLFTDNGSV